MGEEEVICVSIYCTTENNQTLINVAIYDSVQRSFQVAKFFDNDHFSSIESFLIQVVPQQAQNDLTEFLCLVVMPGLKT